MTESLSRCGFCWPGTGIWCSYASGSTESCGRLRTGCGSCPISGLRLPGVDVNHQNFTPVPNALLDHQADLGLNATEALFLIHVRRYQYGEETPFPAFTTIARKMGVTVRHIRAIAKKLEKRGLIKRHSRAGKASRLDLSGLLDPGTPVHPKKTYIRKQRKKSRKVRLYPLL